MKQFSKIQELHRALTAKKVSSAELVTTSLKAIQSRDRTLGAFLSVRADSALAEAKAVDEAITRGEAIDLVAGIPLAVKDNILLKGERATAASRILENYAAAYDATVMARLRSQGGVCVGKTNLDEFAHGASTEHSALGRTLNPHDPKRVPGGSSGGSAAAVAAGFVPYALGSDTGGSVRQPAAFCGVVGFKPTYGRVSRFGLIAMASSLDQIGPLATTVEDAAIVLGAIAGEDPFDATSLSEPWQYNPDDFTPEARESAVKGLRIGVPKEFFPSGLSPAVARAVKAAIKLLERQGADIKPVSLPMSAYAIPIYYIVMPAEVSSNLARFDGVRYGLSAPGKTMPSVYNESRGRGFGREPQRRILLGTYVLSSGYYDAYYTKAKRVQAALSTEYKRALGSVDVLLGPTTPTPAFEFSNNNTDPIAMYLADVFTATANLVGAPAISVPCGAVEGLPVGLQIMARPGDDRLVLKCAAAYELIRD